MLWDKARIKLHDGSKDTHVEGEIVTVEPTVATITSGRPTSVFSSAPLAYDPGSLGIVRELGYPHVQAPHFSMGAKDRKSIPEGDSNPEAQDLIDAGIPEENSVAKRSSRKTRIELLAQSAQMRTLTHASTYAVEYCMPVSFDFAATNASAAEPAHSMPAGSRTWRSITPTDVHHILAVSTGDLVITLWAVRDFSYLGVIHTLVAQDVCVWSSGANLLITSNSQSGPINMWDVLLRKKVRSMAGHGEYSITCIADFPSLGMLLTGAPDKLVKVWAYRSDSEMTTTGELSGVRGRCPPIPLILRTTLEGHRSSVSKIALVDDPDRGVAVSCSVIGEICIWDLSYMMLLRRMHPFGRNVSISAITLTHSIPRYALILDETPTFVSLSSPARTQILSCVTSPPPPPHTFSSPHPCPQDPNDRHRQGSAAASRQGSRHFKLSLAARFLHVADGHESGLARRCHWARAPAFTASTARHGGVRYGEDGASLGRVGRFLRNPRPHRRVCERDAEHVPRHFGM